MAHNTMQPHNISGTGSVTACPPECPEHEAWLGRVLPLDTDEQKRQQYLAQIEKV